MKRKAVFIFFVFFAIAWIFYFGLKPRNLPLIINIKQLTPVSPIYYFKTSREKLQSIFIMGDRDSTDWNFTISQKRATEAKILCDQNLTKLGQQQILTAQKYYDKGILTLNKLIDRIDTNYLVQQKEKSENLIKNTCK